MRPVFVRAISPASESTSRCFRIAGSDIGNGSASSLTDRPGLSASRTTSARRVGSARAANVRSRAELRTLTTWLSIDARRELSTHMRSSRGGLSPTADLFAKSSPHAYSFAGNGKRLQKHGAAFALTAQSSIVTLKQRIAIKMQSANGPQRKWQPTGGTP